MSAHLAVREDSPVEALDRRANDRRDRSAIELERCLGRRDEGVEAKVVGIVGRRRTAALLEQRMPLGQADAILVDVELPDVGRVAWRRLARIAVGSDAGRSVSSPTDGHPSKRSRQRARAKQSLIQLTHRTQTTTFCDEPSLSGAGVLDRDGGNIAVDCGRGVPKPPTSPTLVSRAVSNPSLPLTLGDRARSAAAAPRSMIEPVLNETSSTLASTSDESVSTLRMASAARAAALARNAASDDGDGLKTSESLLALERIEGVRERLD